MDKLLPGVLTALKAGLLKSAKTMLVIAKIIIPITCLVSLLDAYAVLDLISSLFNPFLKIIGLPGESALVLTLGYFVNYYASLGAMAGLALPGHQVTVLGAMVSLAHDLFAESAICQMIGWSFLKSFFFRLAVSLTGGFLLYQIYRLAGG